MQTMTTGQVLPSEPETVSPNGGKTKTPEEALVWQCLATVIDPELNIDIVSLGLIYNVTVVGKELKILMTLTTPGCPLAAVFESLVQDSLEPVRQRFGLEAEVALTFDPPWVSDMMSDEAKAELGFDV